MVEGRRRRRAIALMMNSVGTRDDYEGGLRRGVQQACEAYDVDLFVYAGRSTPEASAEGERAVFRLADPERLDGVVVATGCLSSFIGRAELQALVEGYAPLPIATIGPSVAGAPAVTIDNAGGARLAAEHLVTVHGRRRIACIAGPRSNAEAEERVVVCRSTLQALGIELAAEDVVHADFAEGGGAAAMTELLRRGRAYDGVIVGNDLMAAAAARVLVSAGLRCPEDVSLVGFDDAAISRFGELTLSTVRQPLALQGATAVDLLRRQWAGERSLAGVCLDVELVVRDSCGCGSGAELRTVSGGSPSAQVRALLGPLLAGPEAQGLAERLTAALGDASAADLDGALRELVTAVVARSGRVDLLPGTIHGLARLLGPRGPDVQECVLRTLVDAGRRAHRAEGRKNLEAERTVFDVRLAWERLSTALTRERLAEALAEELPRLGVRTGVVATFVPDTPDALVPLVAVVDGDRCSLSGSTYPARRVMPDLAPAARQRTLTVLPLTFRDEALGVAVLETGDHGFHDLLREQIGGALKRAALHDELLRQTQLHARSREEERAMAERLRSLHLIAGGVAHDLNNALGPLVALPEAIRRDLLEKDVAEVMPAVLDDLETMRVASARASITIRDLMDLGRPTPGRFERIDLGELLGGELARRLEAAAVERNPRARLSVEPLAVPLVVRASEAHLERCLMNLVINAADALEGHGLITVRARAVTFAERHVGFEPVEPGSYAAIEVSDTGVGIAQQKLHRVVEPFYSEKRRTASGGTGLGLAIVQRFVKDVSGFLDIQSEVGVGSTFCLYLPVRRGSAAPGHRPAGTMRGCGERVLVVDDEPVQRRTAKRVLASLGYEVECVASGEEALELFRRPQGADFRLVILDMVMGDGLDGIETYRRMLKERPDQKAMIASGYASEQRGSDAAALGLRWLTKPYTLDALSGIVREVLDGE